MMSWGFSNITPWHSHSEQTEEQLTDSLRRMASSLRDPARAVVNVHVPPFGTQLDDAPVLTPDLRSVQVMGQVQFAPVGSPAVPDPLLEIQPLPSARRGGSPRIRGSGREDQRATTT
jgi:Icc-related predicted phosphoesterase